jgi:hypothetical protein
MVLKMRSVAVATAGLALCSTFATAQQPSTSGAPRPRLFGFALECIDCGEGARGRVGGPGRSGSTTAQANKTYPHVIAVAPGSAAERGGVRPGDELRSIDGLSLLTAQGADRLARAVAGEQVELGFERNAKPVVLSLRLGAPSVPAAGGPNESMSGYMTINGQLHGDIHIEFWSDEQIHMTPDSASGTVIFQIGSGTIIRMKYTKDAADPTNRSSAKKDDQR